MKRFTSLRSISNDEVTAPAQQARNGDVPACRDAQIRVPLWAGPFLFVGVHLLGIQGCIATRDWVSGQITAIGKRGSRVEAQ